MSKANTPTKNREPIAEDTTAVDVDNAQQQQDTAVAPEEGNTAEGYKSKTKAQEAFARGDVEASKAEHAKRAVEKHGGAGSDYVKSIIFGGLDGITTTFAIVAAAAGAGEDYRVVLVFGFANAVADAWSMGFGEFISGTAELDHARRERAREEWEVEHNVQGEIDEMVEIYENKGFPSEDAKALVQIISKDPKRFVDIMMVEELGILVDEDESNFGPLKQGLVMFTSFIFFGIFPLLAYFGGKGQGFDWVFGLACGITGVGLLLLGAAKGFLTGLSLPITAIKMLFQGCISGGLSFGIGVLVSYAITGKTDV